jgi:hypothetical protein
MGLDVIFGKFCFPDRNKLNYHEVLNNSCILNTIEYPILLPHTIKYGNKINHRFLYFDLPNNLTAIYIA